MNSCITNVCTHAIVKEIGASQCYPWLCHWWPFYFTCIIISFMCHCFQIFETPFTCYVSFAYFANAKATHVKYERDSKDIFSRAKLFFCGEIETCNTSAFPTPHNNIVVRCWPSFQTHRALPAHEVTTMLSSIFVKCLMHKITAWILTHITIFFVHVVFYSSHKWIKYVLQTMILVEPY